MPHRCSVLASGLVLVIGLAGCYPTEPGVSSDVEYLEVRAGGKTACALTKEGPTLCWGDNQYGQLGNGTLEPSLVPGPMALGPRFKDIAPGGAGTCALDQDGAPLCWGAPGGGTAINDGSLLTAPQGVLIPQRFEKIYYVCGLDASAQATCWGSAANRFGTGDMLVDLDGGCAVTTEHELRCDVEFLRPSGELLPVLEVETSGDLSCVLGEDGTPYCWGLLGVFPEPSDTSAGTFRSDSLAVLSGERTYTTITVGDRHGCGLDPGGIASCWGDNAHGQVGDGSTVYAMLSGVLRPTPVAGGLKFRSIAAGADFTCGVTQDFRLYCWGANDVGQLGNGTTAPSPIPVHAANPEAETS